MRKVRKRLGEILIDAGLLSEEQLIQSLAEQKKSGLKLGDYLIANGIVFEDQIIAALSRQFQIEKYDSEKFSTAPELATIIPHSLAFKNQLVALEQDAFVLKIAMVDPMDIAALDLVERHTGMEVEPLICSKSEFNLLMNGIYGIRSDMDESLGDMTLEEVSPKAELGAETFGVLADNVDAAPVIRLTNSILRQAVREKASDIHISPEQKKAQIRLRIDGKLHEIPPPPRTTLGGIISRIKILAQMDIANTRIPQDGRFNIEVDKQEINVRASTLPTIYGENLVLRLLYVSAGALPLKKLGLEEDDCKKLMHMVRQPYGMFLSVGPTGSGKSSSLYAILNEIATLEANIVTLEDPVEFRMENVRQVQLNRRAGMTFSSGLRAILRQDPNIIMVGEIRDNETAHIATQAALTGHLVLSTLHTNDSTSTISRLQNMGVEPFLVSASLLGVAAQRLMRRICPHCSEPYEPPPGMIEFWGLENYPEPKFSRGRGCSLCMNSGYKGRVGIFEILMIDDQVREMIFSNRSSDEISGALCAEGKLRLLKTSAAEKIYQGITTFQEATETVVLYQ
ncbi:MAG: Flp pilus assembly complex ATPase component TadA [Desulfobacterales bacterium]|nr:Flp pilus assembly complex ATPase component TadA [Desulfobacterales bacterium]